jgi:outer membrane receptor protein involved in Fe transport
MPQRTLKTMLAGGVCAFALAAGGMAAAQTRDFDVPAGDLSVALDTYARQSGVQIIYRIADVSGVRSQGAKGAYSPDEALAQLLEGTRFKIRRDPSGAIAIADASDPQSGSAAGDGADGTVQALIVTAQKREENIQDVPIAMSAFSQEDLTKSQVTGGPDLMTQVPNFTFTKTNFTGYSIQIRGIGTQAISATTDAAVAVAENNTPFIRNRFFEQEFYDLQRVEVLRGPQGTLYGRNATAGVVNIITAKPSFHYEAKLSADVGNYKSTRFEGMINLPLVDDKVALRIAGAWTKRDGYDTNQISGNQIDGRNLWSTRVSLRFEPTDSLHANLIWEHFKEDDDRLRSGKQLCHQDFITSLGGFPTDSTTNLPGAGSSQVWAGVQGSLSQGCLPDSLYAPASFEAPNGKSIPYYWPLWNLGLPLPGYIDYTLDPYVSKTQSRNLRVIESTVDPKYRAETDTVELQVSFDLPHNLTLSSETGYNSDTLFSSQDFNRFNTRSGVFADPADQFYSATRTDLLQHGPNGGIFCDPQVGCADRLVAVDLSTATSRQFSQEFRLASNFDGPFNFSLGANFLRYDTIDKYYVFFNSVTLTAAAARFEPKFGGGNLFTPTGLLPPWQAGVSDNHECMRYGLPQPDPMAGQEVRGCIYIDPNPIESVNDQGHNYFLSKNPYKLISYAVFGEAYYNLTRDLKLTAGLRWTVDRKQAPRIPSWVLASQTVGYPVAEVIKQEWREPTGRLALDWKPDLSFTDETLLYASFAHGYKAGGANPPRAGIVCYFCNLRDDIFVQASVTHPKTFDPEFVNAYEVGSKNTLLDGKLTLNLAGFYYDYKGYQISQIVDRSAVNLNFDATVWGLELESDWRPLDNLRFGLKLGYENTRVAKGMKAVDIIDRTAGHSDWIVVRPDPVHTSNCILPLSLFVGSSGGTPLLVTPGRRAEGGPGPCELAYFVGHDPITDAPYVDLTNNTGPIVQGQNSTLMFHPGYTGWNPAWAPNNGEGFYKDLSGNELPNAPHYTATLTVDYTLPLPSDWLMTLHGDFYQQSEAWARIFNMPGYDKLKAYNNVNFAAIFTNEDAGWKVMAYVKNVFDKANITGAFLNSDDTGLTTNVFLNEPRLYGLRVTKEWTGGPWWTGANPNHTGPYPFTVEISGQVQHQDAPNQNAAPQSLDNLPAALAIGNIQNRRLDWGDGRSIKLSYRPDGAAWFVSGAYRYGRTNSRTTRDHHETQEKTNACRFPASFYGGLFAKVFCDPNYLFYGHSYYSPDALAHNKSWSAGEARGQEQHTLVDFEVGRDFGLGAAFGHSSLSTGIRYGEFRSSSHFAASGVADWNVPDGWLIGQIFPDKYQATHNGYQADLTSTRKFKGAGPMLSWDAATHLLGSNEAGHVDLDWSVTGGVLFGKQTARFVGKDTMASYAGYYGTWPVPVTQRTDFALPANRSKSATAPVVDLSLGLSYDIQRIKVGAGYRWERYFNVLDTGYAERKATDRTIDGPYFKIAVGFGG